VGETYSVLAASSHHKNKPTQGEGVERPLFDESPPVEEPISTILTMRECLTGWSVSTGLCRRRYFVIERTFHAAMSALSGAGLIDSTGLSCHSPDAGICERERYVSMPDHGITQWPRWLQIIIVLAENTEFRLHSRQ